MKGSAPKSSSIGFQMLLIRNLKLNLLMLIRDCETSSKQMSPTTATTARAHRITMERNTASARKLSFVLSRFFPGEESLCGPFGASWCVGTSSRVRGLGTLYIWFDANKGLLKLC